jgi:hypothetical protein
MQAFACNSGWCGIVTRPSSGDSDATLRLTRVSEGIRDRARVYDCRG